MAALESAPEDIVFSSIDQLIFKREGIVSWVLEIRVNKSITNRKSLEVKFEVLLVLELEVVGDGWDVVTSVRLASDIEVLTLKLWILLKEFDHKISHVFGDFFLIGD